MCLICAVQSGSFLLFFPVRAHILPFFTARWFCLSLGSFRASSGVPLAVRRGRRGCWCWSAASLSDEKVPPGYYQEEEREAAGDIYSLNSIPAITGDGIMQLPGHRKVTFLSCCSLCDTAAGPDGEHKPKRKALFT